MDVLVRVLDGAVALVARSLSDWRVLWPTVTGSEKGLHIGSDIAVFGECGRCGVLDDIRGQEIVAGEVIYVAISSASASYEDRWLCAFADLFDDLWREFARPVNKHIHSVQLGDVAQELLKCVCCIVYRRHS